MIISALLLSIGAAGAVAPHDNPATDPVAVVDRLQASLLDLTEAGAGLSFDEAFKICEGFVRATHDLPYMAKLALGRSKWQSLSDAEQSEFLALFTELSVTTYVTRFQGNHGVGFTKSEQRALSRGRYEVRSQLIRPNGETVAMSYILHQSNDRPMIINIVAEGVSELALKRSEYQRILQDSDFNALAHYIQSKIVDMVKA